MLIETYLNRRVATDPPDGGGTSFSMDAFMASFNRTNLPPVSTDANTLFAACLGAYPTGVITFGSTETGIRIVAPDPLSPADAVDVPFRFIRARLDYVYRCSANGINRADLTTLLEEPYLSVLGWDGTQTPSIPYPVDLWDAQNQFATRVSLEAMQSRFTQSAVLNTRPVASVPSYKLARTVNGLQVIPLSGSWPFHTGFAGSGGSFAFLYPNLAGYTPWVTRLWPEIKREKFNYQQDRWNSARDWFNAAGGGRFEVVTKLVCEIEVSDSFVKPDEILTSAQEAYLILPGGFTATGQHFVDTVPKPYDPLLNSDALLDYSASIIPLNLMSRSGGLGGVADADTFMVWLTSGTGAINTVPATQEWAFRAAGSLGSFRDSWYYAITDA